MDTARPLLFGLADFKLCRQYAPLWRGDLRRQRLSALCGAAADRRAAMGRKHHGILLPYDGAYRRDAVDLTRYLKRKCVSIVTMRQLRRRITMRRRLLLVHLGHAACAHECPLLRDKQTRFARPELFSF